ncbi:uncharacterized protein ChaoS9_320 [Halobacterium phage ChaoS9]|uniref:Uncharacterized protein n=1 Tax=Halobacterium phage ChaoS9 TaxID=2847105 RepID=A0A481V8I1_9CAUD|nr:uncharacterized protein KMC41_gp65 [Halobacterium phage ChaoS9]QBI90069.1 uncharacterized protein ChaoS9_320 [Halobacterium phage ChaoS9]
MRPSSSGINRQQTVRDHVEEWPENRIQRHLEERERAEVTAGPETPLQQLAAVDERLRTNVSPGATIQTASAGVLSTEIVAVEEEVPEDVAQLGIARWARYEVIDKPVTGVIGETADGSTFHLKRRDGELLATPVDIEVPEAEGVTNRV